MDKCKKCGQPKNFVQVYPTGFNVCMCDWDFTKIFKNCNPVPYDAQTLKGESISELKNLIITNIGHIGIIENISDKDKNQLTERLQKMYRILMDNLI